MNISRLFSPAVILCLASVVSSFVGTAKAEDVKWLQTEYDFGLIKEIAGPQKGVVKFVNTRPEEVVILDMRPSCGCTDASFPEAPITTGDTATLHFTYDPTGRPGKFEKSIRVKYSGGGDKTIIIRGKVLGTSESLSKLYPYEAGPLRFTSSVVYGGEVTHGKSRNDFFTLYNQSADSVVLSYNCADPNLKLEASDIKLGAGDTSTFSVFYDSFNDSRRGPIEIPFEVSGGDSTGHLTFNCSVMPDFSRYTAEDYDNAPKITLSPDRVNAGTLGDESPRLEIEVVNEGKRPLSLYNVYTFNTDVKILKYPATIKPGKRGKIEFLLVPGKINQGIFQTSFRILTDDPRQTITDVGIFGQKE